METNGNGNGNGNGAQAPEEFKSFYKTVGGNEGGKCHYPTRLDTYGKGCFHNCSYCYSKSLLDFRKMWHPDDPSVADIEKIKRKLDKIEPGTVLRLGGMTDCFQPCELTHRVTLHTIEEMNKRGIGYLIVTKSHYVANDEYIGAMDRSLAHVQVTVTTTDDDRSVKYERASVPSLRMAAIGKLHAAGFDVALRLSPYIEGYVDFGVLAGVDCDKILVEFLRVNTWIRKWFDIDYSKYTVKHGGYLHLPLEEKRAVLARITGFREVSVCDDVDEHYDWFRDHFNPNPDDCCNLRGVKAPKAGGGRAKEAGE